MRFKGKPVIGLGVVMAQGGNVQTLGKALDKVMADVEKDLPVGITVHRVANQPEVVDKSFEEFISSLLEALAIVLVVSFISLGVRTGVIVALSVPLVLAITFVGHAAARHRLPADLARRADHRARPAGRRRHHRRRDDDGEARARREPARGRDLRLHLDRLPHADRHAGHRHRLRAGGLRALERRRIHQLDLLGGRPVAGHLVVRGRAVHAVDGLSPAADAQGPSSRSLWRPALHRLPQAGRVVRDLAQDHDRHHGTGLRRVLGRLHPGAEAVLPDGQPARADRRPEAGAGRLMGRHRPRSAAPGEVAGREPRRRLLHVLCRRRQPALLPADRAGTVQRELRPGHRHDQGPGRPRARGRRSRTSCSATASRRCAPACSACRTARRSAIR